MKVLGAVCLLLYVTTVSSTKAFVNYHNSDECPKESPEGILITLPHETDCDKFYVCIDGDKIEEECPDGLYFDPLQGTCDFPEIANCKITSARPSTTERISTTKKYPTWPPQTTTTEKITRPPWTKPPQTTTTKLPPTWPPQTTTTTEKIPTKPPTTKPPQTTTTKKVPTKPPTTKPPQTTTTKKVPTKPPTTKPPQTTTTKKVPTKPPTTKPPQTSTTEKVPTTTTKEIPTKLPTTKPPQTTTTKKVPTKPPTTTPRWDDPSTCIGECPLIDPITYTVQLPNIRCDKFCKCSNGIAYVMSCPANLHYNRKLEVCDWPQNANCSGIGGIPLTTTRRPITTTSRQTTTKRRPKIELRNLKLDEVHDFNQQSTTPRWQNPSSCIGKCPLIDPEDYTVQLPNRRCDKFCMCSNGIAYVQSCPAKLHYNKKLKVCDWPLQANCTGIGGIPPPTTTEKASTTTKSSQKPSSFFQRMLHLW